jgi:hypothetical protein
MYRIWAVRAELEGHRSPSHAFLQAIRGDHDERWYQLESGLLDLSNTLLHEHIGNGDSMVLANAIFII